MSKRGKQRCTERGVVGVQTAKYGVILMGLPKKGILMAYISSYGRYSNRKHYQKRKELNLGLAISFQKGNLVAYISNDGTYNYQKRKFNRLYKWVT